MSAPHINDFPNSQPLATLMAKAELLERIILEAKHDGDDRWREPARQLRIIRAAIERKTKAESTAPNTSGVIVTPAAVDPNAPPPITIKMDSLKLSVRPVRMNEGT